jgi:hypothetical protein
MSDNFVIDLFQHIRCTSPSNINLLTPQLNPSAQRFLPRFFTGSLRDVFVSRSALNG